MTEATPRLQLPWDVLVLDVYLHIGILCSMFFTTWTIIFLVKWICVCVWGGCHSACRFLMHWEIPTWMKMPEWQGCHCHLLSFYVSLEGSSTFIRQHDQQLSNIFLCPFFLNWTSVPSMWSRTWAPHTDCLRPKLLGGREKNTVIESNPSLLTMSQMHFCIMKVNKANWRLQATKLHVYKH